MMLPDKSVAMLGYVCGFASGTILHSSTASLVSVPAPGGTITVKGGNRMVDGSVPVVKCARRPRTMLPPFFVCQNIRYSVLGYMPAISKVMVCSGEQRSQLVALAG